MPGEVAASYEEAIYDEQRFKLYDRSKPVVKAVYGEFYWKIRLGERTRTWDYIRPPLMISREVAETDRDPEPKVRVRSTKKPKGGRNDFDEGPTYRDRAAVAREYQLQSGIAGTNKHEVNYVLSEYVPPKEIEQVFGVEGLGRSWSVGALQPFPLAGIYLPAAIMLVVALLLGGLVRATQGTRNVASGQIAVLKGTNGLVNDYDQGPFEIKSGSNLRVSFRLQNSTVNDWVMVRGKFYDESDKGFSQPRGSFAALVSSSRTTRKLISRLPTSRYTLRLQVQASLMQSSTSGEKVAAGSQSPRQLGFQVDQNVPSAGNLILLISALVIPLMFVGIFQFVFESRRWQDTDKV